MIEQDFTAAAVIIAGPGPYPFTTRADVAADLLVTITDGAVTEALTLTVDYTVTISTVDTQPGGTVTLSAARATAHANATLTIDRLVAPEQGWAGQTARERGLEGQLDRMVMAQQDQGRQASRALRFGVDVDEMPLPGPLQVFVGDGAGGLALADYNQGPLDVPALNTRMSNVEGHFTAGGTVYSIGVGGDYATVQDALNSIGEYVTGRQNARLIMLDGYQIAEPVTVSGIDLQRFTLESQRTDRIVSPTSAFPANSNVFTFTEATAPTWGFVLDLLRDPEVEDSGLARNGVYLQTSNIFGLGACGIINAGPGATSDPRGCNLYADRGSNIHFRGSATARPRFSGAAARGIHATWEAEVATPWADFRNCGTELDIEQGHAGLFVSRESRAHFDQALFSGCSRALRVARSKVVGKDCNFSAVPGEVLRAFDGADVSIANGNFTGSGLADHPLIWIGGTDENDTVVVDTEQGGARVSAPKGVFHNAVGDLVRAGSNARVSLDKAQGTGLLGRIGDIEEDASLSVVGAELISAAGASLPEMLRMTDASVFMAKNAILDANSGVSRIVRGSDRARAFLGGATISGWTSGTGPFALSQDAEVYAKDIEAGAATGGLPLIVRAAATDEATVGLVPEAFGAIGDGVADDTDAIVQWAASSRTLSMAPGATYRCATLVSGGHQIAFQAATSADFRGAKIVLPETDTSATTRITAASGSQLLRPSFLWTGANYFRRAISLGQQVRVVNGVCAAEAEQPSAAVISSSGRDTCVKLNGDGILIDGWKFTNIYRCMDGNGDGQAHHCRVTGFEATGYASGFGTNGVMDGLLFDNYRFGAPSSLALADPGNNSITGPAADGTFRGGRSDGAAEHDHYFSSDGRITDLSSLVPGLTVENVRVDSSGQTGVKARGLRDAVFRNIVAANQHDTSAAGENENGGQDEETIGSRWENFTNRDEDGAGNGGFHGFLIDSSQDFRARNVTLEDAQSTFVTIRDERVPGSVRDIRITGLTTQGNRPVVVIETSGKVGDILIEADDIGENSQPLLVTDIGYSGTLDTAINTTATQVAVTPAAGRWVVDPAYGPDGDPHGAYDLTLSGGTETVTVTAIAASTLAGAVAPGDSTITLTSAAAFPDPATLGTSYNINITMPAAYGNPEVVTVTAKSGNVLTVTRGQAGTSARTFEAGVYVRSNFVTMTRAAAPASHLSGAAVRAEVSIGDIRVSARRGSLTGTVHDDIHGGAGAFVEIPNDVSNGIGFDAVTPLSLMGASRTLWVSVAGGGVGTFDSPLTLAAALEQVRVESHRYIGTKFNLRLQAGTYTVTSSINLENYNLQSNSIRIIGPDVATPTAIITPSGTGQFLVGRDPANKDAEVRLENLQLNGFTGVAVDLQYGVRLLTANVHCNGTGGFCNVRNGVVEIFGHASGTVLQGHTGPAIVLQDTYGIVGTSKRQLGDGDTKGIIFNGTGDGIDISRGSPRVYLVNLTFNGAASCVRKTRLTTVRVQNCAFNSFTVSVLASDDVAGWDDDTDFPSTFAGVSLTTPFVSFAASNSGMGLTNRNWYSVGGRTGPIHAITAVAATTVALPVEWRPWNLHNTFFHQPGAMIRYTALVEGNSTGWFDFSLAVSGTSFGTIRLPAVTGTVDRWRITYLIYGPSVGQDAVNYVIEAVEAASGTTVESVISDITGLAGVRSLTDGLRPCVASVGFETSDGEFRIQSSSTEATWG